MLLLYIGLIVGIAVAVWLLCRECFRESRQFARADEVGWAWLARALGVVVILIAIATVVRIGFYYYDVVRPYEEYRSRPSVPIQGLRSAGPLPLYPVDIL